MKEKIVIFGMRKMAQVAHFYFTHDSFYEVAAFTVEKEYVTEDTLFNLPVVPFEELEKSFPPQKFKIHIGIGYKDLNQLRAKKYLAAKQKGYQFVSYIHSNVSLWDDLSLGENCQIAEATIIQPFVSIGSNVIIRSGVSLAHDVHIGDHCYIASQATISGNVNVGPYCFIGANATIRDRVTIAPECIIGAGAVILRDTQEHGVYIADQTESYRLNSIYFRRMMEISE